MQLAARDRRPAGSIFHELQIAGTASPKPADNSDGVFEIHLRSGHVVRVSGFFDAAALRRLVLALEG
jgi:hypothetical protein